MTTALTELPETIDAGTTVGYTRSHSAYPASGGWVLKLYLAGLSVANFTGTPNGDSFDVVLPASLTAPLLPGSYIWSERVTKAGEEYTAADGMVVVNPNIATAGAGDLQSWEEKTLAIVRAAIAGSVESRILEYQIHSRAVKYHSLEELRKLESELSSKVARKKSGRWSMPIEVRFPPTSGCGA